MSDISALTAAVAANTTATQEAVAALGAASDTTAIDAATTQINDNTAALKAAIPPAPTPTPAPTPEPTQ